MINYSNMTLQECHDNILLRAGRHRGTDNIDWQTVVNFINNAVKEVMTYTIPYKSWGYISTIKIYNRMQLPVRFYKPIRTLLSFDGLPPLKEGRYINPKEWHKITHWETRQDWNKVTAINPVYTIWGNDVSYTNMDVNNGYISVYIAPNTDNGNNIDGTDYQGIMDCYLYPREITNNTDPLPVPYEYEQLVILSALTRLYAKTLNPEPLKLTNALMQIERQRILNTFIKEREQKQRNLESFVEPKQPYIPPSTLEGELPQKL